MARYGERDCCALCGQDIEYHGVKHGWIDRGGDRRCVAYTEKGEIVIPSQTAKHAPFRNKMSSIVLGDIRNM